MSGTILHIAESRHTPEVKLDATGGNWYISGKSFPENAEKFYRPIIDWLEALDRGSGHTLHVEIALHYINSSSVFTLLELISTIKKLNDGNWEISVDWLHDVDDEDIRRIGEDYVRLTSLQMRLVALTED